MSVLTGSDGELLYDGTAFAKCRDFALTVTKDALDDTCLGAYDRTYVEGLRGTSGTATLLYDPANKTANEFLNTIFNTPATRRTLTFKMNRLNLPDAGGSFAVDGFLTSVSPSVTVGDIQAVAVTFQVSGAVAGGF